MRLLYYLQSILSQQESFRFAAVQKSLENEDKVGGYE